MLVVVKFHILVFEVRLSDNIYKQYIVYKFGWFMFNTCTHYYNYNK